VKKTVILTSLAVGVFASNSFAAEIAIKGNITEVVSGSDNYFLTQSPKGPTGETLTAGTLDFLAQTPTTNIFLNSYYSYYKYFGPGASDTSLIWGTPAHANLNIDHTEELTKYNVGASWTRSDATQTSLAQTGVASGRGSIDTYAANAGITQDLSRVDLLSWTAVATKTTFTNPTSFPFVDVSTTAAWKHSVSSTTTLNNFVSFDWFSEDNPQKSQRLFWKLMTGISSQLSPRLNFIGNVGIGFVNSYQTASTQPIIPLISTSAFVPIIPLISTSTFVPQTGAGNSILADIALTYQLLKTTTLSFTAAQAVTPLFNGQLQKTDQAALTLNYGINHWSNLTFTGAFTFVPATTGNSIFGGQSNAESEFFSASVGYNYRLSREWNTNLSYSYLQRNQSSGTVRSNLFQFTLSRDFTLLGNPTAINLAERERARERARENIGYVFPNFH
jgi:hypothetical protein